jgi:thiol-disulfide isomerase/thioredoxin
MLFTQTVSLELTHENYDQITEGKTVFIKHYAPWCGHCKAMARDWKKSHILKNKNENMLGMCVI